MHLKKTILTIFALTLMFTFSIAKTQAETGELRLTTSPLPINLKVSPGSSISTPLKIKNDGSSNENLKTVLMKFKADPNTGGTILLDREPADTYFDWVTFSDNTFTLEPGKWKTVMAKFDVPSSAAFDYYYAIVFLRTDQQVKPGDRQTILNGGTATMVLLTADVAGAKKELQLEDFSVSKNIFEFLPVNFNLKIKNVGDVHAIPHGNIFISKGDDKNVAILDVNDTQGSILPNSPRSFQSGWKDGFPIYVDKEENGTKTKELKWNWADASKLRWGKYTAKLLVIYDNGQRDVPIESEVTFWVIPWRLVGGGLLITIFVFIGLKSTIQNFLKKIRGFFDRGDTKKTNKKK